MGKQMKQALAERKLSRATDMIEHVRIANSHSAVSIIKQPEMLEELLLTMNEAFDLAREHEEECRSLESG